MPICQRRGWKRCCSRYPIKISTVHCNTLNCRRERQTTGRVHDTQVFLGNAGESRSGHALHRILRRSSLRNRCDGELSKADGLCFAKGNSCKKGSDEHPYGRHEGLLETGDIDFSVIESYPFFGESSHSSSPGWQRQAMKDAATRVMRNSAQERTQRVTRVVVLFLSLGRKENPNRAAERRKRMTSTKEQERISRLHESVLLYRGIVGSKFEAEARGVDSKTS